MGDRRALVLGGTGHYGRHVVDRLLARDAVVRVLTRDAARARGILPDAVEIVEGDLLSGTAVARAMDGVDGMVVAVSTFALGETRDLAAVEGDAVIAALERARASGPSRVVYLSVFDTRTELADRFDVRSAAIKKRVEAYLSASDLDWTVLGAPPSMEIFFSMLRGNRMVVPGGGPPAIPTISPVDVGEIAAQAVLRDDLGRQRLRLAGPDLLSFREAAERLSACLGRRIGFVPIPLILPTAAWYLTRPLARVSAAADYAHSLLGLARLMNAFPQALATASVSDHRHLLRVFDYTPTTLEMEARRRS